MQPFAKIINKDNKNEQIWGDYETGCLYVFHLPTNTVVDLTSVDKGAIWPASKSIKLEQVDKKEIDIEQIINLGKSNKLDWKLLKFYDYMRRYKHVVGPLYPKKVLTISAFSQGRFLELVKKHHPELVSDNMDYFESIGAAQSSTKNKLVSLIARILVFGALSLSALALVWRVVSVNFMGK